MDPTAPSSIPSEGNRHPLRKKRRACDTARTFAVLERRHTWSSSKAFVVSPATRMEQHQFTSYGMQGQGTEFIGASSIPVQGASVDYGNIDVDQTYSQQFNYDMSQPIYEEHQDGNNVHVTPESEACGSNAKKKKGVSKRGKAFSRDEDLLICSAWLNVSKEAVIGTNQPGKGFYARVYKYFVENGSQQTTRTKTSVGLRWGTIQKAVSKFSAMYSVICRRNESGKTEQDRINDAIKLYTNSEPWVFAHCWEVLRYEPKWNDKVLELNSPARGKRDPKANARADAVAAEATASTPTPVTENTSKLPDRPEGRDATKRRRACANSESSTAAVNMLRQIHEKGQEQQEVETKYKEEMLGLAKLNYDLQHK